MKLEKMLKKINELKEDDFTYLEGSNEFVEYDEELLTPFKYLGEERNRVCAEIMDDYPKSLKVFNITPVNWGGTSTINRELWNIPTFIGDNYFIKKDTDELLYDIEKYFDIDDAIEFLEKNNVLLEEVTFLTGDNKTHYF